ncbi:hypothetical protein [Streptomyces sp. NPDC056491]|uniref:hypothetical protein n=1 Tax=unclassified Streptomyces TaxID=2593676 RepID=UPI0036BE20F5
MRDNHRVRALALCALIVIPALLCWYGTRTVRPADCQVSVVAFADGKGQPLPDLNGKRSTWEELDEQAYREEVEAGRCAAPQARWRQWLD